jgi:hypothetical protein
MSIVPFAFAILFGRYAIVRRRTLPNPLAWLPVFVLSALSAGLALTGGKIPLAVSAPALVVGLIATAAMIQRASRKT